MIVRLPFIGQIATGKDIHAEVVEPTIHTTESLKNKEKFFDVLGGLLQFSENRLSTETRISSKILKANKEWVYRNNDVIAQEVSKINFQLYSVGIKGGEIVYKEIDEHALLDLLDKFNSRTTKSDGIYTTQTHKKLTGDAFWFLDKNGKAVQNIFIIQPDKVELKLADTLEASADLVQWYEYRDNINGKMIDRKFTPDQIIHFKKPNPENPFRGLGTVEALASSIDTDNLADLTQHNFFEKGAISNFVLTTDSKITQDQLKRIRAELRSAYSGAANAYTTMIFGNGLKPSPVSMSNKDMQFLDILAWYRDKIMICFGNSKASIGIVDDVNRASYEGAHSGWLEGTVKPDMDALVGTLNEFLVPLFGDRLILGYENPIPEDIADDIAEAVQLKNAGIVTINEAREKVRYDPIEGGDIFAPLSSTTAIPGEDEPPLASNPSANGSEESGDSNKRIRYLNKAFSVNSKVGHLPSGLSHIKDIKQMLRKRKIFTELQINKDLKEAAKPVIRNILNKKVANKQVETPRVHSQFTNDTLKAYYDKQVHIVDVLEKQFEGAVIRFIADIESSALRNLDSEVTTRRYLKKYITKDLFDDDSLQVKAQLDLTPFLMQELILAGEQAYELIGVKDTYIPYKVQDIVKQNVSKFTQSMLDTNRQTIVDVISEGINEGSSIPEIRNNIMSKFDEYSKVQAERVTRTEVMRTSNLAAEDAFIQSGVVEAKQWLCAPNPCPLCEPYNGKIQKLGDGFYDAKSEFQDGNPPLHPSDRCVLVPIVDGTKAFEPDHEAEKAIMRQKIANLESKVDKRTKAFKNLKAEKSEDEVYIKALEKHLGVDDE